MEFMNYSQEDSLGEEEVTALPQVQMQSVVVVPSQHSTTSTSTSTSTSSSKTAVPPAPELKGSHSDKYVHSDERKRLAIFDSDWEFRKQRYVLFTTREMNRHHGAEQERRDHRKWQQPSNLRRRTYQRHSINLTPRMSLDEWQERNGKTYERFANVPKIFERSPLP